MKSKLEDTNDTLDSIFIIIIIIIWWLSFVELSVFDPIVIKAN